LCTIRVQVEQEKRRRMQHELLELRGNILVHCRYVWTHTRTNEVPVVCHVHV
jgi:hypothetical protein